MPKQENEEQAVRQDLKELQERKAYLLDENREEAVEKQHKKGQRTAVAWPTGEFGGMGLEGAVKLGFRKELEAETDPQKRQALYEHLLGKLYDRGKAINTASFLEFDEVIDPKDTRQWIITGWQSVAKTDGKNWGNRVVDAW